MKKIVLIDMDGVLAENDSVILKKENMTLDISKTKNP